MMKKIIIMLAWTTVTCMANHMHSSLFDIKLENSHIYEVVNLLRDNSLRVSFEEKEWISSRKEGLEYALKLNPQIEKIGPSQYRADGSMQQEPKYRIRNFDEDRDYLLSPPISLSYKEVDVGIFLDEVVKQDSNYSWYFMPDYDMYVIHPRSSSLKDVACRKLDPDELWVNPQKILPSGISFGLSSDAIGNAFGPLRFTRYDYPDGSFGDVHKFLSAFCNLIQKRDSAHCYMWSIRGFRKGKEKIVSIFSDKGLSREKENTPLSEYHRIKKQFEDYTMLREQLQNELEKVSVESRKNSLKKQISRLDSALNRLTEKADLQRKIIYGPAAVEPLDAEKANKRLKQLEMLREKLQKALDEEAELEKKNSLEKRIKVVDNAILDIEKTIIQHENKEDAHR